MRCPNCHSIIGDNWEYCNYCGCDLRQYRRQDRMEEGRQNMPYPEYYYTRPIDYQKAYVQEKDKNEQYRNLVYFVLLGVSLALNFIELLVIVITNL